MPAATPADVYDCATNHEGVSFDELAVVMRDCGWLSEGSGGPSAFWLVNAVDPREVRRVAVVLLLVLAVDRDAFDTVEPRKRAQFLELIKRGLGGELRRYGVDPTAETHVLTGQLAAVVQTATDEIRAAAKGFSEPGRFQADRNTLQTAIGRHRAVFEPFIPLELSRQRLSEVLDAVEAAIDAEGPELVGAYGRAIELIDNHVAELSASNSLARDVLLPVIERLRVLAERTFSTSPVTQPAVVSVVAASKKYPLHLTSVCI